jgi:exodeoxyribonuclease VII large subunit
MNSELVYSVTDFQAVCNQILDSAFSGVVIEGEVASFKVNQNKFIFFDLKDDESSIGCFMMAFALRFPLEDGMKVRIRAIPKLTKWGKFSLTVQSVMPVGEGSIKKSLELLKKKLTAEGLFAPERKRRLPEEIEKIGVISSTQAAGYADFCKIMNERWGGLSVTVAHTQVQGAVAADQIIRALQYFNERSEVQVIALIRGGGSADDLAVFNDEKLVRAIAASKIPVITGIGHEIDTSLCDLAADVVASTPSNAAQMLTRDRKEVVAALRGDVGRINNLLNTKIDDFAKETRELVADAKREIVVKIATFEQEIAGIVKVLDQLNPEKVLARGYALMSGKIEVGSVVNITTLKNEIKAEIKEVAKRN